jgi:NhaC family Na+:H+ antiporter
MEVLGMSEGSVRKPNLLESLIVIGFAIGIIGASVLVWKIEAHIPLLVATVFAAVFGLVVLHKKWSEIEEGMVNGITVAMSAILIMYTIGMVVASWIQGGIVPSMVYYGLSILKPSIFLLSTLLICSIVSLATGSSWGTSGTVGIALIGIAAGLGVPMPLAAGVIISGAYLGDKMSPLSDTTNLAPAVAGSDLFQHIRAMIWTTGPTYLIVMGICVILGMKYSGGTLDAARISAIKEILAHEFHITPLGLVPPLLVIGLVAAKIPALPGLVIGIFASGVMAIFQGISFPDILNVLQNGYSPTISAALGNAASDADLLKLLNDNSLTGIVPATAKEVGALLEKLLGRGGLQSMNWTVSLSFCALAFGGVMEKCGYLDVILEKLLYRVRTVGGLVFTTLLSSVVTNILLADQYLAIIIPGRMFKKTYEEKELHSRMLSRSLEDAGTITSVLVPWNSCGAYHAGLFGVPTLEYLPYAFLNWMNPIMSAVLTYMGIGIAWRGNNGEPVIQRTRPAEALPCETEA